MKCKRLFKSLLRMSLMAAGLLFLLWLGLAQPSCRRNELSSIEVEPDRLREDVEMLSMNFFPRDWRSEENLRKTADFILEALEAAGAEVKLQPHMVRGRHYWNVIGKFNPEVEPRIVVGAHYDAVANTPGADDNASGVAALLAIARLVGERAPEMPLDFVAYVLEEPPFFGTADMGSVTHARALAESGVEVEGVIVLEMVGYFSDEPGSQKFPSPLLRLFYPNRGNFIALVSRSDQGAWIRDVKAGMKGATPLPVYSFRAPIWVPGVDFSDHRNYWPHGIPALMVTNTAFYRNQAYHLPEDTADRLDYTRMAQVVVAVFEGLEFLRP
ncbi:MAG: M28 family peptidase [Verrucomicrobia bacterium]|nr:M28 family peptidase [Verrucomicrobiota bacterium]